jgi:hypothetical protein
MKFEIKASMDAFKTVAMGAILSTVFCGAFAIAAEQEGDLSPVVKGDRPETLNDVGQCKKIVANADAYALGFIGLSRVPSSQNRALECINASAQRETIYSEILAGAGPMAGRLLALKGLSMADAGSSLYAKHRQAMMREGGTVVFVEGCILLPKTDIRSIIERLPLARSKGGNASIPDPETQKVSTAASNGGR